MIKHGRRQRLSDGDVLIAAGQDSPDLYILLEGLLSIHVPGLGAVGDCGVGEIVGEMSFVDSQPPSATVTVKESALVLALDKEEMLEELRSNAEFASRFYRALAIFLSDRLRKSNVHHAQGKAGEQGDDLGNSQIVEDELDLNVLDAVSQAGENFNRLIRRLAEGQG